MLVKRFPRKLNSASPKTSEVRKNTTIRHAARTRASLLFQNRLLRATMTTSVCITIAMDGMARDNPQLLSPVRGCARRPIHSQAALLEWFDASAHGSDHCSSGDSRPVLPTRGLTRGSRAGRSRSRLRARAPADPPLQGDEQCLGTVAAFDRRDLAKPQPR